MAESSKRPLGQSFFNLPNKKEIEVVFVELADGRIVPRSPEELELEEKTSPAPIAPAPAGELVD